MPVQKRSEDPFFSIIIPTFNSVATLKKALESLTSQTFTSFEVRIMDNVSTDGTREVAEEFFNADDRIKWISEKDKGIYHAMNKAIEAALGEWIFFLGSDDYLFSSDVLESVFDTIHQNRNVRLVYGNVWLSKPLPPNLHTCQYGSEYKRETLLQKNLCHQCMFHHRDLFRQFGLYRTKYIVFADWDFNHRMFNKTQSLYIDKTISYYSLEGLSGTNPRVDTYYGEEFLENMATRYSYHYKHKFFDNKKRQLFGILLKQIKSLKLPEALRASRILAYQSFRSERRNQIGSLESVTNQ